MTQCDGGLFSMYVLIIVAAILSKSGHEIPLYTLEIPAKSKEDCLEAIEYAVLRPYVVTATCEKRDG